MEFTQDEIRAMIEARVAAQLGAASRSPINPAALGAPPTPVEKLDAGVGFTRFLMSIAASRGDARQAAKYAEQHWGAGNQVSFALGTSPASAGGTLVPEVFAQDVIEYLRPINAVMQLNPQMVTMDSGNLTLPRLSQGASAGYKGESVAKNANQPSTDEVRLSFKELICIVPISNQLLRYGKGVETLVRDDAVAAINQKMDEAFIAGDGTQYTPRGLINWAETPTAMTATPDVTKVTNDLAAAEYRLRAANSRMIRPGWIVDALTYKYLTSARTGASANEGFAFRDEVLTGKLNGKPMVVTNNMPSSSRYVILADFADVLIGQSSRMEIAVSDQAAYLDSSGTMQAAFSRGETLMRVTLEHDLVVRHPGSVTTITGVTWGA